MISLNRWLLSSVLATLPATALAATGGPDAAGYTWADSDHPGVDIATPGYNGTDLVPLGLQGDDAVIPITLPIAAFPTGFPFYGTNYTSFWLSTNGWLSFVDPALDPAKVPANVPNAGIPNATVAFFWDDWSLAPGTPVANGGPNTLNDGYTIFMILEPKSDPSQRLNMYVTLFNTGVIKFVYYGTVSGKTSNSVIGIESAPPGQIGLPYMVSGVPQNGANFRELYAIQFFPDGRLNCASPNALTCNRPASSFNNNSGGNNVTKYNCASGSYLGNEKVLSLSLARTSNLTLTLNNTDAKNRALFFMSACSEYSGCAVGGSTVLQPKFVQPGNYLLVVDGVTATDNGNFTVQVDCQDAATGLPCNTSRVGDSIAGTSALSNWSCASGMNGPEKVYEVNVTGPATLRATLSNPSMADVNLLISDAANFNVTAPACLTGDPAQATVWGAKTGTYLVTVDSSLPTTSGSYDISVECSSNLVCPSPASNIIISPPTPVSGDTTGKPDNVDAYYCSQSAYGPAGVTQNYTGGEDVYEFTLSTSSIISFIFDTPNPDLRLLILKDCYEGSCIMEGGCGENLAPGTYRLVVDGLNGASGPYTFTPFVVPAQPYNRWYQCPEGNRQSPDSVRQKTWRFDSGNFCGTGCDFSLFAVVECGTEFHVPLWDDETGHMQIFDVLQQRYMDLTAVNNAAAPCNYSQSGTRVNWDDNTCSMIPCPGGGCGGGNDCRTNGVTMDVSFRGTPNVCGVYKIDFLNWGGYVWEAFGNCSGTQSEQFYLYRDLCSALANYHPLPEVGISNVTLDNGQCGANTVTGSITVENVGCLPAASMEIIIEQAPPAPPNPQTLLVSLIQGQQQTVPWSYTVSQKPASLVFKVDPARRILECSENLGQTVQCGAANSLQREITRPACPAVCSTSANAGSDTQICENEALLLDAQASVFTCISGTPWYQWEDATGTPIPGCSWSATPTCNVPALLLPPGPQVFSVKTRCQGDTPACETAASMFVNVIPNVVPPALENVLRAYRDVDTVRFSWAAILGSPISGYRLYRDSDRRLPPATRFLVGGTDLPWTATTTSDEGAVPAPPRPIGYYQIVGVSCFGNLEGPY